MKTSKSTGNKIDLTSIDLEKERDKITDLPGLIKFAHSVGSAIIKPEDKGRIKGNAVAAMHDENESGNMDFNFIGLPTEIYGFSNNKRPGLLGPPGFKACMFKIDKPVVKIKIHLK